MVKKATKKELMQIHNIDALMPIDPETLSEGKKRKTIASLIFHRKKRWENQVKTMC